jgi:putative transposase
MSRKAYPTDVSDVEWDLIKSMIPAESKLSSWKKA